MKKLVMGAVVVLLSTVAAKAECTLCNYFGVPLTTVASRGVSEEDKTWAIKLAYKLNGNSMMRQVGSSIDVSISSVCDTAEGYRQIQLGMQDRDTLGPPERWAYIKTHCTVPQMK
jgi:hypothetical protein